MPPERHTELMSSTQPTYLATYKSKNVIDIRTNSICKYRQKIKLGVLQYNYLNLRLWFRSCIWGCKVFGSIIDSVRSIVASTAVVKHSCQFQDSRTDHYCSICDSLKSPGRVVKFLNSLTFWKIGWLWEVLEGVKVLKSWRFWKIRWLWEVSRSWNLEDFERFGDYEKSILSSGLCDTMNLDSKFVSPRFRKNFSPLQGREEPQPLK